MSPGELTVSVSLAAIVLFSVLKLLGIISASWWWLAIPVAAMVAAAAIVVLIIVAYSRGP